MDIREALRELAARKPLIHCISNIVSANDCANLLLAVGASPMMALAEEEMAEIAAISSAAVLNTGTPDAQRFRACALRGEWANRLHQPCVLDPVGVGASEWRFKNVRALLEMFRPDVVRVNLSEARALLGAFGEERGVDSEAGDIARAEAAARALAQQLSCTVLLSGAQDFVSDGARIARFDGGSALCARLTGSGCMLSALCGAFAAITPDAFTAASLAAAHWKNCAARAEAQTAGAGPLAFRAALIDGAGAI